MLGQRVRRRTHYALRAPFKQLRQVSARSACVLRHTHAPPALRFSARAEGNPKTDIRTGHCFAALGPVSRAQAPRAAQPGPSAAMARGLFGCWMFGSTPPSGCACGGAVAGWHGRRSAHASCSGSPWLSERRAQRKASSTAHPATVPSQVCPVAKRRGRRLGVAFLLGTFLWRSKEKYLARRGDSRLPHSKRACGSRRTRASTGPTRTDETRTNNKNNSC